MNRDEADRAITALGEAKDRVATAMYAIDSHPGLAFLRSGGLAGRTREIWTALEPEIDARWTEFAALGDALEEAGARRAGYRPSDTGWAPLVRSLTTDIPRLVAPLEAGCATIVAILGDVDASWTAAGTAVAPVTEAMTALSSRAADLGDSAGITPLDRRAAILREQILADPLGLAPGGRLTAAAARDTTALAADIKTAAARLAEQTRVRDAYPQRIAALGTEIDAVETAERAAAEAYARTAEKIASPGLPAAPRTGTVLRARVAELDTLRAKGDWRRLADTVTTVEASIGRARERAAELTSAADGLLDRRTELRGRLEAYRAKAAGNRLEEHDVLSKLHATAQTLLYTAPCDLPAATKAVFAYQRALAELIPDPPGAPSSQPSTFQPSTFQPPSSHPATAQEDATR